MKELIRTGLDFVKEKIFKKKEKNDKESGVTISGKNVKIKGDVAGRDIRK